MNEVSAFGVIHKRDDSTRLIRQHGLTGAPPKDMPREERMALWEARSKKLNAKRDKYQRRSNIARVPEHTGEAVGGAAGAAIGGAALRDAYFRENPAKHAKAVGWSVETGAKMAAHKNPMVNKLRMAPVKLVTSKPGWRTLAVAGAAGATSAVAGKVRTSSDKKARKYSSMRGGVASGAYRRMKDYS